MTIRERHLEKLAAAFFEHVDYGDSGGLGLDCKRPFGWSGQFGYSVLEIVGVIPEDPDLSYSDTQVEYGDDLFAELKDFIVERWTRWSAAEKEGERNA